jgi:lysophospholipase L1-like esterase
MRIAILAAAVIWAAQPAIVQPADRPADQQAGQPPTATPSLRTDQWWTERHEAFNARAKQGHEKGDIGIVFLGDSITEGWLGAGKEVWDKFYAPRNAADFGIGGDRTQHVLYRIQNGNLEGLANPKAGRAPALAIIMIGTNNTGSDSASDIAAGITAIVHAVRERLPETKVLLLAVFPRGDVSDPARAKIAEINSAIAPLADGGNIHYLDIGAQFLAEDGSLPADIMPDKLHLSPKGYQIWADAMEPKVSELLK